MISCSLLRKDKDADNNDIDTLKPHLFNRHFLLLLLLLWTIKIENDTKRAINASK